MCWGGRNICVKYYTEVSGFSQSECAPAAAFQTAPIDLLEREMSLKHWEI